MSTSPNNANFYTHCLKREACICEYARATNNTKLETLNRELTTPFYTKKSIIVLILSMMSLSFLYYSGVIVFLNQRIDLSFLRHERCVSSSHKTRVFSEDVVDNRAD